MKHSRTLAPARPLLVLLALLAPAAHGQTTLFKNPGPASGSYFGWGVADAGDVDADGVPDYVVTLPFAHAFEVHSGVDGTLLYGVADPAQLYLGASVDGVGDVNGDGFADVLVGAHYADGGAPTSGRAFVFGGPAGTLLRTFDGGATDDRFGNAVALAGDVNGDGVGDLIVGANGNASFAGRVQVFSGSDGSVLHTFDGDHESDMLGTSVDGAGDVDADGVPDVVVGAPGDDDNGNYSGSVRLYSGATGAILHTFHGAAVNDGFGLTVAGAGDLDGDGHDDVAAGGYEGNVRVYSGATGAVLLELVSPQAQANFGWALDGGGDLDGDGVPDLVVGAPLHSGPGFYAGHVLTYSGADGSLLFERSGQKGSRYGSGVAMMSDLTGDGRAELLVGAPLASNKLLDDNGKAFVLSGCTPIGTSVCGPAVPNSTGLPAELRAFGAAAAATNSCHVSARALPPERYGYFLMSETQDFVANPGGSQGNLCLGGTIGRFVSDLQQSTPQGSFTLQVDLGHLPGPLQSAVLPGETWLFQAWYRDVNPTQTSNFTDAISVPFS